MPIRQLLKMGRGAVIDLETTAEDDVWILANNRPIARAEIIMVGDGNGEFTKAVGLEMDGSGFGLGKRSQRYAMIVEDGVVTKLSVEAPGQFEVSKAEAILEAL